MIEEVGRIVAREGDRVWIEAERRSACGGCSAASGCGTQVLQGVFGRRRLRLQAEDTTDARVGEQVRFGLREDALLRGSVAVYLVPLLTLLGGALLGEAVGPQWGTPGETATLLFGGVGLAAGFLWVRSFGRRLGGDRRFQAVVLGRMQEGAPVVLQKRRSKFSEE